jgi:hypothetical protein
MSWNIIPVNSKPDHTIAFTQDIDGVKRPLMIRLRYNLVGGYWYMGVMDAITRKLYADNVPILRGDYPCADILEQFGYKGIGKALAVKVTDATKSENPNARNLGVEFSIAWGDDSKPEVTQRAMG